MNLNDIECMEGGILIICFELLVIKIKKFRYSSNVKQIKGRTSEKNNIGNTIKGQVFIRDP